MSKYGQLFAKTRDDTVDMVDIKGLDKVLVLAALYNHALSPGQSAEYAAQKMTPNSAQYQIRMKQKEFYGEPDEASYDFSSTVIGARHICASIGKDSFDPTEYDRHNGKGKARAAVESVRLTPLPTEPVRQAGLDDWIPKPQLT